MSDLPANSTNVPNAVVPFHEVAILIAQRNQPPGEALRTTVDKVRKRIAYAVRRDDLQFVEDGPVEFLFGPQVFAWARRKWPEAFGDISETHDATVGSTAKIGAIARSYVYPAGVERCHELLRESYREAEVLKEELEALERELVRLRPLAERYETNREKNRKSAKLPRKGV